MKILIVDDSQAMRKIIKWSIRQADIQVEQFHEADCSDQALQIVELKKPDLIIVDWNMPQMAGLALLNSLRNADNAVRFGFVITQTTTNIISLAKHAGADFIISNPSSADSFKAQINQAI